MLAKKASSGGYDVSRYVPELYTQAEDYAQYADDPHGYAESVLRVHWHAQQTVIADALIKHRRVMVKAGNGPGKTFLAGGLVNWFYDCFNPGICLTTAPTAQQVDDALWKEVRVQRRGRPGLQPKASRMESSPDHYAVGYTANTGTAFQGRHERNVFIIFDEGTGITAPFWESAEGMMTSENCYWLVLLNPTDTASRAYEEEQSGRFHTLTLSALDHPNIISEQRGDDAPYPSAVRLEWVNERVKEWCTPIEAEDKRAADFQWRDTYYRPGPLFEARVLGRWPSAGGNSVWNDALWQACLVLQLLAEEPTEIGCDVARFGDDYTSIVVRRGNVVLWWETHNGWGTDQTAGRLKQLAGKFAQEGEDPKRILIKVDDDGVGGGVYDQRGDYRFIRMNAAAKAMQDEDYPNRRSEYWFATAERAGEGRIDVTRLPEEGSRLIRQQLMAPKWKVDSQGRRVVEPKPDMKKRMGRSPDDADAFNLAFAPPPPPEKILYNPTGILGGFKRARG